MVHTHQYALHPYSAAEQGLSQALLFWCFGDTFAELCTMQHSTCLLR